MPDSLLLTQDGAVATVVLNRPARRNAIDLAMRDRLREILAGLDADPAVRVVVLTGSGTAFCAGVDLTETASGPDAGAKPVAEPLWSFRKPLIAAVNGPAVGGGLELALACDIRIAAASARFGLPEVRIGSLPGSGGTQRLPRIVGPGLAAWMILTGELVDAAKALRSGLVTEVVPDEALATAVADLAHRVAFNAPLSLVAAKEALRGAEELGFSAGQALERRLWSRLAATEDRAEGRAAFRERREPRFTGR
jgi:E-phenylitaconyl-CoA hydratase